MPMTLGSSSPAPPPEGPDARLAELVRRRAETVERLVPAVLVGDDADDVHDLRVATRRLQQALESYFTRPFPARVRSARRRLRKLRRALGEWRNADVLLAIVGRRKRRARGARRRDALGIVEAHLVAARRREIRRARRRILHMDAIEIARDVERALDEVSAEVGGEVEQRLIEVAGGAHEAFASALARAESSRSTEDVHALRIAGKRLRYRLELAAELGDEAASASLAGLKKIQTHLGDWHDRQVLHAAIATAFARPALFLEAPDAIRAGLAEIAADRPRDAGDLDDVFALARAPRSPEA
jgi:CHAD domain-containing protein